MLQTTHKGLSGTALKTIALVLMLMDHIHYFLSLPDASRNGSACWRACRHHCFCSARWKALPIRMTASGISSVSGASVRAWRRCNFHDLCQGVPPRGWLLPAERDLPGFCSALCDLAGHRLGARQKYGKGIAAIAAVVGWPYLFAAVLGMFPQLMQRPIVSTVLAFVITSPVPMWTSITDGGWSYLVGGVLLYLLRNHRKAQVAVWALYSFLWDFVLVYLQLRGQPGFELSQMFTTYYEWFGVAAAVLMLAYNGTRGSGHKQLFYWFYPAHVYLLYGVSCLVYRLIA